MYDLVSELNASKTQVFECKQDCGRYLSFHCHMQSHSCEYCTCVCFTCLSSKISHTTSKTSLVYKTTTAGIDVPAINASGTATDVMTTADDSLAITAMEAVNGATTANDDLPEPLMRLQLLVLMFQLSTPRVPLLLSWLLQMLVLSFYIFYFN